MKDYLISMFIDNELDLDDKIDFVETVHREKEFKDEAVALLDQEKLLQADMVAVVPEVQFQVSPRKEARFFRTWFPSFAGFATAMALMAGLFLLRPAPDVSNEQAHRFVIYRPDVSQTEIIGSFTNWTPVAMEKIGESGYWSITLPLPEGEHRYSYRVENDRQIADPTVLTREQDDFGGENSIIKVNVSI